ncbi:hypothetical protein P389DRAFT_197658 [Cystobasidium minutum MCA 4210]|uniref:uncharacterized protein n=1 Tax=Cystobasidium minutum MCA 4210 TaxID=1397322 RepID=UPI0034CFDB21|eukprot:jgi/Rhomi1/197658/gm1.5872_g
MASKRALVVGGSGFLGSSVCRALIKHGYSVTSLARNGQPSFQGPQEPSWSKSVNWVKGSAFDDQLLRQEILPNVDCVVHTLGILFEEDYKSNGFQSLAKAMKDNLRDRLTGSAKGSSSLFGTLLHDDSRNPLAVNKIHNSSASSDASDASAFGASRARTRRSVEGAYERINRDSALKVLQAFLETRSKSTSSSFSQDLPLSPFIYVSAEDIFRPFVPDRYILTKREAEDRIIRMSDTARTLLEASEELAGENEGDNLERPARLVRPVLVRPGLMYDFDTRPITRLPTTLLRLSSSIQGSLPSPLRARTLSKLASSISDTYTARGSRGAADIAANHTSMANLLSTPPLHVDVVGEAIARAVEMPSIEGVLDVQDMRSIVEGRRTGDHAFGGQVFA